MTIKNTMLAVALAFAARCTGNSRVNDIPQPKPPSTTRAGRNLVRALARQGRSTNMPHQSTRETARRLGGAEWEAYKAADRARRGLEG